MCSNCPQQIRKTRRCFFSACLQIADPVHKIAEDQQATCKVTGTKLETAATQCQAAYYEMKEFTNQQGDTNDYGCGVQGGWHHECVLGFRACSMAPHNKGTDHDIKGALFFSDMAFTRFVQAVCHKAEEKHSLSAMTQMFQQFASERSENSPTSMNSEDLERLVSYLGITNPEKKFITSVMNSLKDTKVKNANVITIEKWNQKAGCNHEFVHEPHYQVADTISLVHADSVPDSPDSNIRWPRDPTHKTGLHIVTRSEGGSED